MNDRPNPSEIVKLPDPVHDSGMSLESALRKRRSVREYAKEPLTLPEVSQLLWSAQGVTDRVEGLRTVPSAGALFPLEVYLVAGQVTDLPSGVYKYRPRGHDMLHISGGDKRRDLASAAIRQSCVGRGAIVIVLSAVYERVTSTYGTRGIMYVDNEVGLAAENVCLQAVAMNLGTVYVGAFDDRRVKKILGMPGNERPRCLLPVGRPR
ncbi:MAG: SagB/ThcOx family dehydrogenase [Candidatus Latescibacterota bacterium]|nr:MAG: SagB/ThcOx family dehydrogenase [Candidatus Latescibacterota bacterium]